MAIRPWIDDVRHYGYTPATIHYDMELDSFFIARADIRSSAHPHLLTLVVAVSARDLIAQRLTVQEAILLGEQRLDHLVRQYRGAVTSLDAPSLRVFDLAGMRLR
jgi:hypothetical protein